MVSLTLCLSVFFCLPLSRGRWPPLLSSFRDPSTSTSRLPPFVPAHFPPRAVARQPAVHHQHAEQGALGRQGARVGDDLPHRATCLSTRAPARLPTLGACWPDPSIRLFVGDDRRVPRLRFPGSGVLRGHTFVGTRMTACNRTAAQCTNCSVVRGRRTGGRATQFADRGGWGQAMSTSNGRLRRARASGS